MSKSNSWFKLSMFKPGYTGEAMFGTTEFKSERDSLYPDRVLKLGASIIWVPSKKAHICVASYLDAFRNNDEAAITKLAELGIPAGINFGYKTSDDLSCMYDVKKESKSRAPKKDSVKVMRAEYAAEYEDGTKFKAGEIVKILFRKRFVKSVDGSKRFQNVYERPTEEELRAFLDSEKGA